MITGIFKLKTIVAIELMYVDAFLFHFKMSVHNCEL